jgi:D-erythronate 2-dehydrogenase
MHIIITGAGGFVGSALVRRILAKPEFNGKKITRLTLIDQRFDALLDDTKVCMLEGSFGDEKILDAAFSTPVDVVFHLASVPGALAERDFHLGYENNLLATFALFERAARQTQVRSRIVFASSIAVYGADFPAVVDNQTRTRPATSYGAHKLAAEIILADLSRRGVVDGVSLRLPGIVARPGVSAGHGSAFMSAIIQAGANGNPYTCPVSPEATSWWMSLSCCIDNLLHAARFDTAGMAPERALALPVLRLSAEQVIAALERVYGSKNIKGISHAPLEHIERLFGRQPVLDLDDVLALGFTHDGTADEMVVRALQNGA